MEGGNNPGMNRVRLFLVTGFGSGWLPGAPGTWGSLAAAGLWLVTARAMGHRPTVLTAIVAAGVIGAVAISVALSPWAVRRAGREDPSFVVIDEWAGQWVALLGMPWLLGACVGWGDLAVVAAVQFVLFRVFDITKPWPCRRLEKLPAGWGIVADDLAAGLWALVAASAWAWLAKPIGLTG